MPEIIHDAIFAAEDEQIEITTEDLEIDAGLEDLPI